MKLNIKSKSEKIQSLLRLMLSSETVLKGEYFVIHSDLIYDLINTLKGSDKKWK